MSRPGFLEQFARARAEIRSWKKNSPHLLPEWHDLKHAEDELERAKTNLKRARAAWDNLGKDPR